MSKTYSVYKIESPNGKKYFGMTCKPLSHRCRETGYTGNEAFREDRERYRWDEFEKSVIASGLTKEEAGDLEREMIAKHRTQDPEYGYNVEMGGVPVRLAESTRKKMSAAHKGLERGEEYRRHISESKKGASNGMFGRNGALNPKASAVIASKDGNECRFGAILEACRVLELPEGAFKNVSACCKGKRKTAYGYKWRYADDSEIKRIS